MKIILMIKLVCQTKWAANIIKQFTDKNWTTNTEHSSGATFLESTPFCLSLYAIADQKRY